VGGVKKRRDSKDSMNCNKPDDGDLLNPTKRRQRSFSPTAREKNKLAGGGLNFDFKQSPPVNDEDDADLQAAIAMSMAAAEAAA
jgi:hypothetical protein